MKKIALLLALMMAATMCLASCNNTEEGPATTTPTATTTTAGTTTTKTPPPVIDPGKTDEDDTEAPELADSTKFTLDGSLAEWEGLHTISIIGEKSEDGELDTSHKKVTFYGVMTDAGLYLACDAYHDVYTVNPDGEWWANSNFEFFVGIGRGTQMYVHTKGQDQDCGTSSDTIQAKMVTEVLTDGPTDFHTITEVFIPIANFESEVMYNTVDVGVAWKTVGDLIIGGHGTATAGCADEYWVPKGNFPWDSPKPIVAPSGIYLPSEYEF